MSAAVSNTVSQQEYILDQIQSRSLGCIHDWHQDLDQSLIKVVYTAFGYALTLKIYGAIYHHMDPKLENFKPFLITRGYPKLDLDWLDEYIEIDGHMVFDRVTAKWLKKIGYSPEDKQKMATREIMDQIEEYRRNDLVIASPNDLFMVARYNKWHGTKPKKRNDPPVPINPLGLSFGAMGPTSGYDPVTGVVITGAQDRPEPKPAPALPPPVPVDAKEKMFRLRMEELASLLADLPEARSLFIETRDKMRPLAQWGEYGAKLHKKLEPWREILDQLAGIYGGRK